MTNIGHLYKAENKLHFKRNFSVFKKYLKLIDEFLQDRIVYFFEKHINKFVLII
jgi:hypothetical protein